MNVAFLVCVEKGNLENQAMLLCRSIRRFGGRFGNAPIHCFKPRQGPSLGLETMALFEQLHVSFHDEVLNPDFDCYPIFNKVFVCAWAERNLGEEILVFLDSDSAILQEPSDFFLPAGVAAAVRPVDRKNKASAGPRDRQEAYWQKLYDLTGVQARPFVQTAVNGQTIRGYWNAGLIVARRSAGVFGDWRRDFELLMKAKHFPPHDGPLNNMDQFSLATSLSRIHPQVRTLDYRYNYNLQLRALYAPAERSADLAELVHIHYHLCFNQPDFLQTVDPPLDRHSAIYRWLNGYLPFHPVLEDPLSSRRAIRYVKDAQHHEEC